MKWTNLFKSFFDSERIGGIVLLFCTVFSLVLANSAWGDGYTQFWHTKLNLSAAGLALNLTLEQWINDGLMTLFFLLVGLEIERELYVGELSNFSNAAIPLFAAVGGMMVPAVIHYSFNHGTVTQSGFGVPMATDIAFGLGMLSLAGDRVPYSLKIFLTALAIIDDLGAIMMIAVFYSSGIQWGYILVSAGVLFILYLIGKRRSYHPLFYLLPGVTLWYCMMQSGIHPTIAGVLLAFVIPFSARSKLKPSYQLQAALHKPVAYIILPLFALANTAIIMDHGWITELGTRNSLGIFFGLVAGKPMGILLFCWLLTRFKSIRLPENVGWENLTGAALLGGIGFTMSIFMSNLAYAEKATINYAKVAVLIASLTATILGLLVLFTAKVHRKKIRVRT